MKLFYALTILAFVGCNPGTKDETMPMPGAYSMLSTTINDGKKDTTYTTQKQMKIFTEDYMMYANINPADSISGFGIGSYKADTGTVVENIMYNANDSTARDTAQSFTLHIEKTPKGYKQVIPNMQMRAGKITLTEEYESVGTATKSAMDGAWKQTNAYSIKGKDTTQRKSIQFKVYYAGHIMFGHTYTDSAKKLHTGMGYGTFEMNGTNKVKENVSTSTYYQVRGKSFDLDIEMMGADGYKQTITDTAGVKGVEIYQRLKK
jgi:hypothetical protein